MIARDLRGVVQDAGDVVLGHLREIVLVPAVEEGVLAPLEERLVDVHAAAVLPEDRLRHEGRVDAVLPRDLLDRGPVGHDLVGHLEGLVVAQVDLVLARGHLVVAVLDADPHLLEGEDRLPAQVRRPVHGEAVEVAAHVEELGCLVGGEIEELELGADVEGIALVVDLLEGPLEHVAGVALVGGAVGVQDVADHPGDRAVASGRQGMIWKVVGSGMAIMSLSSIRAETRDGGAVEPHPLLHPLLQLGGGDAEDLLDPEDIGEPELDETDVLFLDDFQHILCCL